MTALSDALAAAQAKALAALEKSYMRDLIDSETLRSSMDQIGCTDTADQLQLLAMLDTLKIHGASEPTYTERRTTEKPTDAQVSYMKKLADDHGFASPDLAGMSRDDVSKIIDELKAGSYDPDKHALPF